MADINPVINSIQIKDRPSGLTKQAPKGDPFSITGQVPEAIKGTQGQAEAKQSMQEDKNSLLMDLSREILKPIQGKTDIQTSQLRELVSASKILAFSSDKISEGLLKKLFVNPQEVQKLLMQNDKGQTTFTGEAFDILRMLAKLNLKQGQPLSAFLGSQGSRGAQASEQALTQTNAQGLQGSQNGMQTGAMPDGNMQAGAQATAEQGAQMGSQASEQALAQTNAQGLQGSQNGMQTGAMPDGNMQAGAQVTAEQGGQMGSQASEQALAQTNAQGLQGSQNGMQAGAMPDGNMQAGAQVTAEQGAQIGSQAGERAFAQSSEQVFAQTDLQGIQSKESTENIGKALYQSMQNGGVSGNTEESIRGNVVSILRHFDCYANQDNSLKAILYQLNDLKGNIFKADRDVLDTYINKLEQFISDSTGKNDAKGLTSSPIVKLQAETKNQSILQMDKDGITQTNKFLKNDLMPMLSKLVSKYQQATGVREPVVSTVHYVARYDKADPMKLDAAIDNLSENLKSISTLTKGDIEELKSLIFNAAKEIRIEQKAEGMEKEFLAQYGVSPDEDDMASLLSKAMNDNAPARMQKIAFNLLGSMIESESPVMPLMHYMIPIEYKGSETYLEMYVDKDCEGRKGNADSAVNIFFTIESEDYGKFEVDLLARDRMIDLDINAPSDLQKDIKSAKDKIRAGIEESGYRLAGYKVNVFRGSKSAEKQFPKLKEQKTGMDVKV